MAENKLPAGYFNAFKYEGKPGSYVDPTISLANTSEMVVSVQHEPTGRAVFFKAFISAFNESYSSDWVSETVFGRSDPIQHFKQTSRRISLGLIIPAATAGEAYEQLGRVQQLVQFLYPNYTTRNAATTLTQNPLVRLKVMNLAQRSDESSPPPESALPNNKLYESYVSTSDADRGLLGVITNLNIAHNLENADMGVIAKGANTILPKMIELNLDFVAIHEATLGWIQEDSKNAPSFGAEAFPYGIRLGDDTRPDPDKNVSPDEQARNEQARQNADRRYGVAFAQARFNKDKKWLEAYEKRLEDENLAAIYKASQTGDMSNLSRDEKYLAKNYANYGYLASAQTGARAAGYKGQKGKKVQDFVGD
jgi:hypothetical protein